MSRLWFGETDPVFLISYGRRHGASDQMITRGSNKLITRDGHPVWFASLLFFILGVLPVVRALEVAPLILIAPVSQTVNLGANVNFAVVAVGTPPLSYRWLLNGVELTGKTASNLVLTNVQYAHRGTYAVVVTNTAGAATNTVFLTVAMPPAILIPPQNQTKSAGANALFSVTAIGTAPLSYQWQFNRTFLPGATNATLALIHVQAAQAGNYRVLISNRAGSVSSPEAILTVKAPPTILSQPTGQTVNAGSTVTFNVTAIGDPPLSYQWQFNGIDLAGATSASLTLSNVQTPDAGSYAVAVRNDNGDTPSFAAELLVASAGAEATTRLRAGFWVADGPVHALLETNGLLYLGGSFSNLWPNTGSGALFDAPTGLPEAGLPYINGEVNAVAPDGAGGWYIGGNFSAVGGLARERLAHLRPDKSVDPQWEPAANQPVRALAVWGSLVYLGGQFTSVNGQIRNGLAAVEGNTGALASWNPDADGPVYAIAMSNNALFVGGQFGNVGRQPRLNAAALDVITGEALAAWNPSPNAAVFALVVANDHVCLGGEFVSVGGSMRSGIAAVDARTGAVTGWNPAANNAVLALAVESNTVYAGGYFTEIGGRQRKFLAALDTTTGAATPWNPSPDSSVSALAIGGGVIYVGGQFTQIDKHVRPRLASLNLPDGSATAWSPNPNQRVQVLAVWGQTVYAGGQFTVAGAQSRSCLAAIDIANGRITAWNPGADAPVLAMAMGENCLYVGGEFMRVGGQGRNFIAALDLDKGQATPWNAPADDFVRALAVSGATVYVGGHFKRMGMKDRGYLAALEATTGEVTAWNPNANGPIYCLALGGNVIYAGGQFSSVGGLPRNNLASLDPNIGNAFAGWNPNADGIVSALHLSGKSLFAGGNFRMIGGEARACLAELDSESGRPTAWNPTVSQTNAASQPHTYAVAAGLGTVYAGGQFNWIGGKARGNLAALEASGQAGNWHADANGLVRALAVSGRTVYAGGQFSVVGGQPCPNLAVILPTGPPAIISPPRSPAVDAGQTVALSVAASGQEPLSYQWRLNGADLFGATNATLTLANVQLAQAGEYSVMVNNALGTITSATTMLAVLSAPVITGQSPSQLAQLGQTVTFEVSAVGTPPFAYQWRLNGVNIPGATNSFLTIANVQPTNSGTYSVVVANALRAVNSQKISLAVDSVAVLLSDNFADATLPETRPFGSGRGSNANANRELLEPKHAGKTGGKSVWMTWRAPATGVATFSTAGSSFDTLLAVYTDATLSNQMQPIAFDEDSGGFLSSEVSFNATEGALYRIAIDGFGGAFGDILLNWDLVSSAELDAPKVLTAPISQTAVPGDDVSFTVVAQSRSGANSDLAYRWFHKAQMLPGATNVTLVLTNVHRRHVGPYRVEVSTATRTLRNIPAAVLELGPNREARTEDKFKDLAATAQSPLKPASLSRVKRHDFASVTAGILGSQILDTFGSTTEEGEENHAGTIGGASRWFTVQPQTNGTLRLDTQGSDAPTVLAVYQGADLDSLTLVASDNDSDADGVAVVSFPATGGTDYHVAVDTDGGESATIVLNWLLGSPPSLVQGPLNQSVPQGAGASFGVTADGVPAPYYQWSFDDAPIAGATNAALALATVQFEHVGDYQVTMTNVFGGVLSPTASLEITNEPPVVSAPTLANAGTGLDKSITGIGILDPNAGASPLTLTLAASQGVLSVSSSVDGGVTSGQISNNGTATVTVLAPLAALNATLSSPEGIVYQSNPGFTGLDALTVQVNDNGNDGLLDPLADSRQTGITVYENLNLAWRHDQFSLDDLSDPAKEATVWGDHADPDQDSRDNLLEYALGTSPTNSLNQLDALKPVVLNLNGTNYSALTIQRRKNDLALLFVPEVSADKSAWTTNGIAVHAVTNLNLEFESVTFKDLTRPLPGYPRFFRLKVIKN